MNIFHISATYLDANQLSSGPHTYIIFYIKVNKKLSELVSLAINLPFI